MIASISVFYMIMSIISIASYFKMIMKMIRSKETDTSISSWFLWWVSSIAGVLYAYLVVDDLLFLFTSTGHLLGTSVILVLQCRKQKDRLSW